MSPEKAKTEIPNPRRILAVSLADSAQHLSEVLKDLTGTHPTPALPPPPPTPSSPSPSSPPAPSSTEEEDPPPAPSLAGTTHLLPLRTPYYAASVPVWLDLVASPAEWAASFLSAEAREVLEVLGGVLVVFALPPPTAPPSFSSSAGDGGAAAGAGSGIGTGAGSGKEETERERARELITQVGRVVREGLGGWEWDGVGLAVGVGGGGFGGDGAELDEWEDLCAESGLEFVHVSKTGAGTGAASGKGGTGEERNEYGERIGMARVLEALEANDWSGGGMKRGDEEEEDDGEGAAKSSEGKSRQHQDGDDDYEFDPESLDFGFDREDFAGLREAILASGGGGIGEGSNAGAEEQEEVGEEDVEKLERMMLKLQAVRDASAGLPEEQRRRMAARAVGEVMKEL